MSRLQQQRDLDFCIQRDNGFTCLFCKEPLGRDYIREHLSNNRNDNRRENIALACRSCNLKKINNFDYQIIAAEKLKQNEDASAKFLEDREAHKQYSSEIEISKLLYGFAKKYLTEQTTLNGSISFDDTLAELTYLTQEKYGHGSENTFRRILKSLTCKVAKFQVVKNTDNSEKLICKRNVLN